MSKKDRAAKAGKHTKTRNKAVVAEVSPEELEQAAPAAITEPEKAKAGKGRLDDRQITLISKALADPTRMAVLRAIANGGATCGDLRTCAGISAATLSHHMKELETAGLIETERNGRFVSATLQRKVWKNYLGELKSFVEYRY